MSAAGISLVYRHYERTQKTFSALFAFIALSGGFLIIATSFDCAHGITKRTLTPFWPKQFANSFITLYIIYQGLYVYLHPLRSECNQLVVRRISITIRIRNASQSLFFFTKFQKTPKRNMSLYHNPSCFRGGSFPRRVFSTDASLLDHF